MSSSSTKIVFLVLIISFAISNGLIKINPDKSNISKPYTIINGTIANMGEFPFFAKLETAYNNGDFTIKCGATLLSDLWLISVSHCVRRDGNITAYFGLIIEDEYEYSRNIHNDNIVVHSGSDLVLLKVTDKLEFTNNVSPIHFPSRAIGLLPFAFRKVSAIGLGEFQKDEYEYPSTLRFTNLKILTMFEPIDTKNTTCSMVVKDDSELCLKAIKKSSIAYLGDSGSPLVFKMFDKVYLMGVIKATVNEEVNIAISTSWFGSWITEVTGLEIPIFG